MAARCAPRAPLQTSPRRRLRHHHAAIVARCSSTASVGAPLADVLSAARLAASCEGERTLRGSGEAFGLAMSWSLRCDGATLSFAERVLLRAPGGDVTLRAGYDAAARDAWQTDLHGLCALLAAGDDARDRSLLFAWLRSGVWAAAAQQGALSASLVGEGGASERFANAAALPTPPTQTHHLLSLALPGSPLAARVWLAAAPAPCVPLRAELAPSSAGAECWQWLDWPHRAVHTQPTGERSTYTAEEGDGAPPAEPPLEQAAGVPAPAPAADWDAGPVEVARCAGGQFLLRALLGEQTQTPAAWWALDTACDGSAVSAAAADAAALPSLGRAAVPGLGGALAGALRRGPLRVGPLALPATSLHLQLSLDGALQPPDASVLDGVLGSALLQRCVLELRAPRRAPGARAAPAITAALHPPGAYTAPDRVAVAWQALHMIDGAPHVRAAFTLAEGEAPHEGLFRLALGVGGTGALLSCAAAARCGFAGATTALQPSGLESGPGEGRARLAAVAEGDLLSGRLDALQLGGAAFRHVRCLQHAGRDPPDLALSARADGMLCADLVRGVLLVLDVPGGRFACVTLPPEGTAW